MRTLAPRLALLTLIALLVGTARLQAIDSGAPRSQFAARPHSRFGAPPAQHGGLTGALDGIRDRAGVALGRGMPVGEANLARGFILGQDSRIDAATVTDFKRSGLAHLLAVSGENVMLLALLAAPLLGLAGLGLRARLICVLVLIAIYVPVTGAGPSIQRAGIMGATSVIATLAGRPRSRAYAIALAALATLAWNPHVAASPSWQLSFAAVIGIALWTARIRDWLVGQGQASPARRALAEGAAVTIAAGLATAPLMAHDFDAVSVATLPANLLALPAVAPAMWLGMLTAIVGQVPGLPVEPINWLNSLFLAYIAQVAHWCAAPGWALVPVRLQSWPAVVASYAALALSLWALDGWLRRRRSLRARPPNLARGRRRRLALVAALALLATLLAAGPAPGDSPHSGPRLRLDFLDVGQGDAILLRPSDGGAVLVDGGPHGDGLSGKLASLGVTGLAAAAVTHDQADHVGGIEDALGRLPIGALVYGDPSRPLLGAAAAAHVRTVHVAEAARSAPARCGSPCSGRRATRRPRPVPTPTCAPSSCSSAGRASRRCSPPTPRPRPSPSIRGRSTSSRSPTTAASTPASTPCSTTRRHASP